MSAFPDVASTADSKHDKIPAPAPGAVRIADIVQIEGRFATILWDITPGSGPPLTTYRDPLQLYNEAVCCHNGIHGRKLDLNAALVMYTMAAQQEFPPALNNLANFYEHGVEQINLPKDEKRAFALYYQAALQEYTSAEYALAVCFQRGIGVPVDLEKAVKMYQVVMDKNTEDNKFEYSKDECVTIGFAFCNVGLMHLHGNAIIKKDLVKAVQFLKEAVKKGDMLAQNWLDRIAAGTKV